MALARPADTDALREVGEWVRPVTLAGEQLLAVLEPLAPLFPEGGLRRGSTVTVEGGPGATSLALALGAAASARGSWVAGAGLGAPGWLAAAELGVALERVVVSPAPAATWATVVATLLDAVDLVWAGLPGRVSSTDARRLAARARERGSVLVPLLRWSPGPVPSAGCWPGPADVRLVTAPVPVPPAPGVPPSASPAPTWVGLGGDGAGRLQARRVEVVAGGRGASVRERRVSLWLPGPGGEVRPAEDIPLPLLGRMSSCPGA
ncbi:MAG: hypothetical protein M3P97_02120 [Actinomycetota bacterium]|nr:hypothetical protein [Actinomycetota bacterium]